MKLISIAVPCYNSEAYMEHAIASLLPGGELDSLVEVLVVDDGSAKDHTLEVAQKWEASHPGVVRAIHQENAGHGGAVMTGLRNATGQYFKVVDSDDWVDEENWPRLLQLLRDLKEPVDLFISNFIYDKVGASHKHVVRYTGTLPKDRVFTWDETRPFPLGHYMQMHSVIYRTEMLREECRLELPTHTFYVDELYVYLPLPHVKKMYYMDETIYHYFIGRDDQSVQEDIMIRRIDQALRVNRLMVTGVDLNTVGNKRLRDYMRNYVEIITTVSSVLLTKAGTPEHMQKRAELWAFIEKENPGLYRELRHRLLGRLIHLPGKFGRGVLLIGYKITQKIFGFN